MSRQFCLRTVVSCYRGMATDTIHLSLSNWMGEKEGIDRMVGGGRTKRERRQEEIQAVKLLSYNKILDYTVLQY